MVESTRLRRIRDLTAQLEALGAPAHAPVAPPLHFAEALSENWRKRNWFNVMHLLGQLSASAMASLRADLSRRDPK
jgi:hypothetical protein